MPIFSVIDTGSGQDTFYQGMVKDAANWATLESLISGSAGDVYYFNGTTLAKLGKGTAGQVLTQNSGLTAPEWAAGGAYKFAAETRAMDAASGDVTYTGAGFTPRWVYVLAGVDGGTAFSLQSWGLGTGATTNQGCMSWEGSVIMSEAKIVYAFEDTGKIQSAVIKSFNTDGMVLTWTRTGATASATLNLYILYGR